MGGLLVNGEDEDIDLWIAKDFVSGFIPVKT